MKSRILITGGAGFIGSNLAYKLVKGGNYDVTILDNFNKQVHGRDYKNNATYKWLTKHTNLIEGDVCSKEALKKALREQDIVVHLAAETGTGQSMYALSKYADVNQTGTALLLEVIMNEGCNVQKIILASSRAIYGEGKYRCKQHGVVFPGSRKLTDMQRGDFSVKCPRCGKEAAILPTDEDSKIQPQSVYGITKQNQEQFLLAFSHIAGIPAILLRFQNVYGPGQSLRNPYTGILSIFSNLILNKKNIDIFEDGKESRDFVFIEDVVDSILLSIKKELKTNERLIFNVGSGESVSVFEVATKLKHIFGLNTKIEITGNFRKGDIRHNVADLSAVKKYLGYQPKTNFEVGLKEYSKWVVTQTVESNHFSSTIKDMKRRGILQ